MIINGKLLTKKEFEKITQEFNEEQKRWEEMKIGDLVYEEEYQDPIGRSFFEHEIVSIDVDNRELTTKDNSLGGKINKLKYGFDTIKELEKQGIKFEKK